MLYMAKINNVIFSDYSLTLLAFSLVDTLPDAESYLYLYDLEAKKVNVFFQKINDNKTKFGLSRKEIDLVYDIMFSELNEK